MAQYDVYLNPRAESRATVPYVIDVQSPVIDALPTRLVMPMSRLNPGDVRLPQNLCPLLEVEGEHLTLMPHLSAPLAARLLKKPVSSVQRHAHDICAALDAVLSGL